MFRIENVVFFVVIFGVVKSQDVPYLRAFAQEPHYTFECDSDLASLVAAFGNLFYCDETFCLDGDFDVCDSIIDCPNFADETPELCGREWEAYCDEVNADTSKPFNAATCENKMCITECDMCDGKFLDCSDRSDELNCSPEKRPNPKRCAKYNRRKRAVREPDA